MSRFRDSQDVRGLLGRGDPPFPADPEQADALTAAREAFSAFLPPNPPTPSPELAAMLCAGQRPARPSLVKVFARVAGFGTAAKLLLVAGVAAASAAAGAVALSHAGPTQQTQRPDRSHTTPPAGHTRVTPPSPPAHQTSRPQLSDPAGVPPTRPTPSALAANPTGPDTQPTPVDGGHSDSGTSAGRDGGGENSDGQNGDGQSSSGQDGQPTQSSGGSPDQNGQGGDGQTAQPTASPTSAPQEDTSGNSSGDGGNGS